MVETIPVADELRIEAQMEHVNDQRVGLARELVLTLPSFGRWVSSIWNSETPFGRVSHRQVTVLYILRKPQYMKGLVTTPSNFAVILSVRKSVVTRVLASLESGGFIRRVDVPDDGRSQLIELTERGHALSVYIEEIFHQEMMGRTAFLSEDETDLLLRVVPIMNRISSNLEQARRQRIAVLGENPYDDASL